MPTLSIRRYRPGDADAVWTVHEKALRASPLAFVEEAAVDDDITEVGSHYLDDGEFLVGEVDDGSVDGTDEALSVVVIGGYLPVDSQTIEIKRMRAHPDHQRRGYASELLEALERRACVAGFERAVLETIEPLQAARSFYEDAGYDVVATFEDDATGVDRYRYETSLP